MTRERCCPKCSSRLPDDAPAGLCPRCLLDPQWVIKSDTILDYHSSIEGPGTRISHYELLELIGEGGMGLVYLAEQQEPVQRRVALKIIKPGMDTEEVIARFEAERQTLAMLDHPNIAHVFDAGMTETGRPYFVMEHVRGLSITEYSDERRLPVEERLKLFKEICEGVHHAHQKGIIHRDIKPSNILVSVHGDRAVPKIIDFGIAKAITQPLTDKTRFTYHGQLLGTPEYMSPEQVDLTAADIDTRSDIYSLGVLLYELLAGLLPFDREAFKHLGFAEIQRTIREEEPSTPSARLTSLGERAKEIAERRQTQLLTLARRLHRELEWIPMKAMRKDRTRRYRSASELADDIQNYVTGAPLMAGPESSVYRARKFMRKHAGSVTGAALIALAIILGLGASTTMYAKAEGVRQEEVAARESAEQARLRAEQAENAAKDQAEKLRRALYVSNIQLADAKHQQGDTKAVKALLESCPNDLRGWEWNHLDYIADQATMVLSEASYEAVHPLFSPDGKLIASGGWGKSIKIWDVTSGSEIMDLTGHEEGIWCVAFSPDGHHLASASADKTVKVWDVQSGRELRTLRGHDKGVCYVTFSPDGKRLASAEYGPAIKIWDAETGAEVTNIQRRSMWVMGLAFSPDGKCIASCNKDGDGISVWDTNSGAEIMTIPSAHKLYVTCVAYSPDGKSIISCGWDSSIKVWDASTGNQMTTLRSRGQRLNCVGYDSSGNFIVAPDQGDTISVWDTVTGEVAMTLTGHEGAIRWVSFSSDGRKIISGSEDKTIRVWHTLWSKERMLIDTDSFTLGLAYSPDGQRFATGGLKGGVTIWDAAAGAEFTTLPANGSWILELAFSPDGRWLAAGSNDGTGTIWDVATGTELATFGDSKGRGKAIVAMAFSPDGSHLAASGNEGVIRLYDTQTGEETMKLAGHKGQVGSLAYYPDGSRILSVCWDDTARVWDTATGTEVLTLNAESDTLAGNIAISHEGRLIATGTNQGRIILWDAETGKEVSSWTAHTSLAQQVSFSPDDKRLASVSRNDSTVKVWDTATGKELMTLVPQQDVYEVAFSPDGSTIAALSVDGILLWETAEPAGGYELRETGQRARTLTAEVHEKHGNWRDAIDTLRSDRTVDEPTHELALQIAKARKWEDASKIVDELYEEHGFYHDVIPELRADEDLDEPIRTLALQIANDHLWYDATELARAAWEVVRLPDKDIEAYRAALAQVEQANSLNPNNPSILMVLGPAQYKTGSYEETLRTFKRFAELTGDKGTTSSWGLAGALYKAMALHQLGRVDEAQSTLEQLRALLQDDRFAKNEGLQTLLAEAEALIEGTEH